MAETLYSDTDLLFAIAAIAELQKMRQGIAAVTAAQVAGVRTTAIALSTTAAGVNAPLRTVTARAIAIDLLPPILEANVRAIVITIARSLEVAVTITAAVAVPQPHFRVCGYTHGDELGLCRNCALFRFRSSPINILESHDIILAGIRPNLDLYEFEVNLSRIGEAVHGADR